MKKSLCFTFFAVLGLCLLGTHFSSCTKDHVPAPPACDTCVVDTSISYSKNIGSLLVRSCNKSTCHPANGDMVSSYATIQAITSASNDRIAARVLAVGGGMPPTYAPGVALTASELDSIRRWKDAGYPN